MIIFKNFLVIFMIALSTISGAYGAECKCHCPGSSQLVCENIENLWRVANTNTGKLLEWERYRPFVERFSERWRKEITDIVEMKMEEYIAERKLYPKPEYLIMEDTNQNDDPNISKSSEDDKDIVSNLIVKVEMVENKTLEVEEELKSERRVRRDLEKEVKETQSSLIYLGDQLQNVTVDNMMSQVQLAIHSSLEDMNKTIYEDHLRKLYYKVDNVVYRNETQILDERLDHVEIELHDDSDSIIVTKLVEDLKTLEENLYLLNSSIGDTLVPRIEAINNSIGDVLIPRIQTLETETIRKNDTENLEGRVKDLLNSTELFRTALVDVWSDIQVIRDLEKQFQNFSEDWSTSLKQLQSEIELLKNESLVGPQKDTENNEIFQKTLEDSSQVNSTPYYEEYTHEDSGVTPIVVQRLKLSENGTEEYEEDKTWNPPSVMDRSNILENDTLSDEAWKPAVTPIVVERSKFAENATTAFPEDTTPVSEITSYVADRGKIRGQISEDAENCERPNIEDDNLLVDVVTDLNGRSHLKFGCRPIGLYSVSYLPVPPRCEGGSWKEPFPTCAKLADITAIESLASDLRNEFICPDKIVEHPDPTNCSQFFKCAHDKFSIIPCGSGLHFNAHRRVCDYPIQAACAPVKSIHVQKLQALVPPVLIEPNNVDEPSSHLGTGNTGQLIVQPNISFTLHCLYPENVWGYPRWNVTYTHSGTNRKDLVIKEGNNRVSLTVRVATEEDSGRYRCITPFGVQHSIEVVVKVVICPAFSMEEEYEDEFYRPSPEGKQRIMGTRVQFRCEEGNTVYAQCMSNGNWSQLLPPNKECTLKKRKSDSKWNCKPLDLSGHPDLILERDDTDKSVTFKCAGGKRLVGRTITKCKDDGRWSHSSLPKCI